MATEILPDPSLDPEETIYACKGCGEILEEGKAFELAGNRWHIQCFRCNTCGTNLDSDANLLLLGDGSLICNNCTYSCSVCNEKIEDLAILTGDQAFCANCFRCRNCKKKIENLKYARTSQGIFCMDCHESLMQRRRKKSQKPAPNRANDRILDKSLPSLPPNASDRKPVPTADTPSRPPIAQNSRSELLSREAQRPEYNHSVSHDHKENLEPDYIPLQLEGSERGKLRSPEFIQHPRSSSLQGSRHSSQPTSPFSGDREPLPFTLQDAPKSRRAEKRRSRSDSQLRASSGSVPQRGDSLNDRIVNREVSVEQSPESSRSAKTLLEHKPRYPLHEQSNFTSPRPSPQPPSSARSRFSPTDNPQETEGGEQKGFLRRVSKSVRHVRSYSDKRLSRDSKQNLKDDLRHHMSGYKDSDSAISTPRPDRVEWLQAELQRERQELLEKDKQLAELQVVADSHESISQMKTELREKRSTMVVLDTQKELIVREVEVLMEHLSGAKASQEPFDFESFSSAILRDFAASLQDLKDRIAPQIEDLLQEKANLSEEIGRLSNQREASMMELDQLAAKNMHLTDLNAQLLQQVQGMYKTNSDVSESRPSFADTSSTLLPEAENEAYLTAPQVVNIRKAQPKKFNWKKGGQNVAKGVKGLKGAFSSETRGPREGSGSESLGIPYGAMTQQEHPRTDSFSRPINSSPGPAVGSLFNGKTRPAQWKNSPHQSQNGFEDPALFGSELEIRAEYERVSIPNIVMRCIQEVDSRGIEVEGIYRKSGGSGQVQVIKDGFERSHDYDISDPDLDINAVTSTLKQYFRKLPTPLITYEVYNDLIDTASIHGELGSSPADVYATRIANTRYAIDGLPSRHRDTLEVLVFHLARVIEHERVNLMTPLNVAVVFAPTIMRPESLAREMQDTQAKNNVVQFLIENCQAIFAAGSVEDSLE